MKSNPASSKKQTLGLAVPRALLSPRRRRVQIRPNVRYWRLADNPTAPEFVRLASSLSCCMPLFGEPVQQHFAPEHHGSVGTDCVVVGVFVRQCAEHIFVDLIEDMADL